MNISHETDLRPASTTADEPAAGNEKRRRRVFAGSGRRRWAFLGVGLVLYFTLFALLYHQDPYQAVSAEKLLRATPVHTLDNNEDLNREIEFEKEPATSDILQDLPKKEISRDGITVSVEKVVFERFYNVREFLEAEVLPGMEGKEREASIRAFHDTRKVVRVFLSITGPTGAEKTVSVQHPDFFAKYSGSRWKCGQSYWQKDIPDWTDGPSIMLESFELVNQGVKMEDIFPLSLTVKLRTRSGETPVEFTFSGLRP